MPHHIKRISKYRKSFLYLFRIQNTLTEGTNTTGLDDIQQINKLEISKSTQNILKIAKIHQSSLIQLNKKLNFYSLFKQDNKKCLYLDLIKKTITDAQWQNLE